MRAARAAAVLPRGGGVAAHGSVSVLAMKWINAADFCFAGRGDRRTTAYFHLLKGGLLLFVSRKP